MVKALSAPMLFDYMAIVMDKQALADRDFTMNVILPDVGEQHMLRVKNGVLLVYADTLSDDADVSITCPKNALFAILTNNQETVTQVVKVEGSAELLTLMMENMNQFPITGANPFNIMSRNGFAGRSVGRPPRSRENSEMLSTQIKSCLFLLETDSFCNLTVALHTRICQPTVKIRITSLSLLSQIFGVFLQQNRHFYGLYI